MPDDLTAKLDALKALCDAATSPVHADSCASNSAGGRGDWLPCDCSAIVRADFLSASRTALPALIEFAQEALPYMDKRFARREFSMYDKRWKTVAKLTAALEGGK